MAALTKAIFQVQSTVSKVRKDGHNPHTKSNFPTLESVLDVLNEVLMENELVLTQFTQFKENMDWVLTTELSSHDGSEKVLIDTPLLGLTEAANKMQALGSAMTYARRYALMALFKLAPTDDDGVTSGEPGLQFVKGAKKEEAKTPKDLKIGDGKFKGKKVSEVPREELLAYIAEIEKAVTSTGKKFPKWFAELKRAVG